MVECVWVRNSTDSIPDTKHLIINEDFKYVLTNTGGDQTRYNVNFPYNTQCDILIIGGGGGGGVDMGGGGGAGGCIKLNNQNLNGLTNINVGKGGNGAPAAGTNGQPGGHQFTINTKDGTNSQFGNNISIGGGYGGTGPFTRQLGGQASSGGSGGGSSEYQANIHINKAGTGTVGQGNRGGFGFTDHHSGGGGGTAAIGGGAPSTAAGAAKGGDGIYSDITGIGYFWAGGRGGSGFSTTGGNGGLGGGGGGAINTTIGGIGYINGEPGGRGDTDSQINRPGGNAGAYTGGGGGGGSHFNSNNKGGNSGSGVVIIKYRVFNYVQRFLLPTGILKFDPINYWIIEKEYIKQKFNVITTTTQSGGFLGGIGPSTTFINQSVYIELKDPLHGKYILQHSKDDYLNLQLMNQECWFYGLSFRS